jgi:hypothetical protein
MEYPTGFPDRYKPRLDREILKLQYKYHLACDAWKRITETIAIYVDIACMAVEKGEWEIGLAHSGLKDFTLELCEDHAASMKQPWWTSEDWDECVERMESRMIFSVKWLEYLNRLDALSEKLATTSKQTLPKAPKQESTAAEIRGERDPTVAARRAELRNMLRSGKPLTTLSVCKRWDSQDVQVPEAWREEGIATWQEALKRQTHRGRVKKLVSKDSKFIRSHNW